jgi:FixJ family two-component response regulator
MVDPNPIVIVIDDDAAFRRSTERLILSVGYKVQTFAAAGEFLRKPASGSTRVRTARRAFARVEWP